MSQGKRYKFFITAYISIHIINLHSFLSFAVLFSCCVSTQAKVSYSEHCGAIVPQSSFSGLSAQENANVHIFDGYFTGGDKIFTSTSPLPKASIPGKFRFYTEQILRTQKPELFHLSGSIHVHGESTPPFWRSSSPRDRLRTSYAISSSTGADFKVSGFWSTSNGMLCMAGTGTSYLRGGTKQKLSVVFTLNYPKESNISTATVNGTLKSVDSTDSAAHFDAISVLGYAQNSYAYTQIQKVRDLCSHASVPIESIGFETHESANYLNRLLRGRFRLEYEKDCSAGANCIGPFSSSRKKLEFLPSFMTLGSIYGAEDGKVHMGIAFTDTSSYGYDTVLIPGKSLVAEGYWDPEKKKLCALACPILKNSSTGDCTIGLNFWFPAIFTIEDRSDVMGRIWSAKGKSDPGYFSAISFRSLGHRNVGVLRGVKYEYTESKNYASMDDYGCGGHKDRAQCYYQRGWPPPVYYHPPWPGGSPVYYQPPWGGGQACTLRITYHAAAHQILFLGLLVLVHTCGLLKL